MTLATVLLAACGPGRVVSETEHWVMAIIVVGGLLLALVDGWVRVGGPVPPGSGQGSWRLVFRALRAWPGRDK